MIGFERESANGNVDGIVRIVIHLRPWIDRLGRALGRDPAHDVGRENETYVCLCLVHGRDHDRDHERGPVHGHGHGHSHGHGHETETSTGHLDLSVRSFGRFVSANTASRRIAIFLGVNFAFMFVELIYGIISNSLGLVSDAGHMLFDCIALAIGLLATYMAKVNPPSNYTYGYGRIETLSGFANGIFLLFIGFFVLTEGVARLFEQPTIRSDSLILVSVLGFMVNAVGLVYFHEHAHGGGGQCSHGHSHSHGHSRSHEHSHSHSHSHSHAHDESLNQVSMTSATNHNMEGIFLHVLADALGSAGVIVSSILIHLFNWTIADSICSIIISVLIIVSVIPLIKNSASILLQMAPGDASSAMNQVLDDLRTAISLLEPSFTHTAVLDQIHSLRTAKLIGFSEPHLWQFDNETICGTLHLQVAMGGDEELARASTRHLLRLRGLSQARFTIMTEQA